MGISEIIDERKIINTCQTCRIPIYEGEPIYISSAERNRGRAGGIYGGAGGKAPGVPGLTNVNAAGVGVGGYGGVHSGKKNLETWTQCAWCYDQWQEELRKDWWFWPKWCSFWLVIILISTVIFGINYPGEDIAGLSFSPKKRWFSSKLIGYQVQITSGFFIFAAVILLAMILVGYAWRSPVNRYKIRERKEEK